MPWIWPPPSKRSSYTLMQLLGFETPVRSNFWVRLPNTIGNVDINHVVEKEALQYNQLVSQCAHISNKKGAKRHIFCNKFLGHQRFIIRQMVISHISYNMLRVSKYNSQLFPLVWHGLFMGLTVGICIYIGFFIAPIDKRNVLICQKHTWCHVIRGSSCARYGA